MKAKVYTADVRSLPAKIYLEGHKEPIAEVAGKDDALRIAACLNGCVELSGGALYHGVVKRMVSLVSDLTVDYPKGMVGEGTVPILRKANGIARDLGRNKPVKKSGKGRAA